MSQDTATATQVHTEEDGHKVFVGNLAFQTTEAELSELFSKPTPVLKVNIITRGARSLGYGFVAYETLAQAEKAAAIYNKTELGGREINVEVAKPKVEREPAAPKEVTSKQPKQPKQPKQSKQPKSETWSGEPSSETWGEPSGETWGETTGESWGENKDTAEVKPRTGRSARSRANRKSNRNKTRNEGEEGTLEEAAPASPDANTNNETKESPRRRKRNGRRSARKETAPTTPAGPPSKTTVFVANLPFAMEDEGLKELFAAFNVTSAHVVRRRGSGRSKGFGFVELADEAEQQKVLEKMANAKADDRELVIKIALSEEQHVEKDTRTKETAAKETVASEGVATA
ncbi:hypothetical protein BGZ51_004397 [Haplosporangium sp. Z 767]|nr:hypothetical protein BGZ51_004397 [Haplosporangium sp. Z 767]KAF9184005.1 hypothetical protein BGZ50_003938 [Haplosporangium sp. Z 11]